MNASCPVWGKIRLKGGGALGNGAKVSVRVRKRAVTYALLTPYTSKYGGAHDYFFECERDLQR